MTDDLYKLVTNAIVVFSIAFVINLILRVSINRVKRFNTKHNIDSTKLVFIRNSLGFIIFVIATIITINSVPQFKIVGSSMLAGAGVIAAILGFASQAAFSNIIAGVFIIIFKPFRINDILEFQNGLRGKVCEITFRHTIIKDYENKRVIIPNSVMNNETIINCTIDDENVMKHILINVSYTTDLNKAIKIIEEIVKNHPLCIDVRKVENLDISNKVDVFVLDWAESAIILRANAWAFGSENAFKLKCDVLKLIKEKFDIEGIEIPYPYRNLIIKENSKSFNNKNSPSA